MATCKPNPRSLFSLSVFILLCISAATAMILNYKNVWYIQFGIAITLPLGAAMLLRIIWDYKIISFRKNRVEVKWPVRLKNKQYPLNEISEWKEEKVKTFGSTFRELTIMSGKEKVKLSNQEFTNYPKAFQYMKKKAARKEVRS